jgi:hypothetical protein
VRKALLHLRALRFGAVMPSHTRHPTQGHIAGQGEAIADALLHGGFFPP